MKQSIVHLAHNGVLYERRGIRSVACVSGALWLTGRGTGDVLLRAGDELDVSLVKDLCVQSLGDSELKLESGPGKTNRKGDAPRRYNVTAKRRIHTLTTRLPLAPNL
jgi:hypothetical protein